VDAAEESDRAAAVRIARSGPRHRVERSRPMGRRGPARARTKSSTHERYGHLRLKTARVGSALRCCTGTSMASGNRFLQRLDGPHPRNRALRGAPAARAIVFIRQDSLDPTASSASAAA